LESLSDNGLIEDYLSQIESTEDNIDNNGKDTEDSISCEFIFTPLPFPNKEYAIADTFKRMQNNTFFMM
jgi:hypothetical protein